MKKIFILLISGLTFSTSYSQEVSDAMRYSQDNLTGTARFRAMGGAFGALGGDLSSLSVNPAGSAIFSNNQVGVTFSNQDIKNNSNYFGTQTSDKENSFILNQAFRRGSARNQYRKHPSTTQHRHADAWTTEKHHFRYQRSGHSRTRA